MRCILSLTLLTLAVTLASACQPTVTQTKQTSWTDGTGAQFSIWDVLITVPPNSASLTAVELSIDAASNAVITQIWEMDRPNSAVTTITLPMWRLNNGGVPSGQSHRFGYIIRSPTAATFTVTSWTCGNDGPQQPPAPLPRIPDGGRCSAVLIIDNYIVRNLPGLTAAQIREKYVAYFNDVIAFYRHDFNFEIALDYVYVEEGGSFSDVIDGDQLLSDFGSALESNVFGQPAGACIYHMLTARQPPGIGGIATLGTACTGYGGHGYTVDGKSEEPAELVIRRMIHEIGHNLAGAHPDSYDRSKGYTCSINEDREYDRILRGVPSYQFLSPTAFISDCASITITTNLPAFSCLWSPDETSGVFPKAIFCRDENAEGGCLEVPALLGASSCYNILNFNDAASSLQVFPGSSSAVGVRLYYDVDCTGSSTEVRQLYSPTLPADFNNQASSFRFITQ